MSRLISLVSLVAILIGLAYSYQTGLLTDVLDPKVLVMKAESDIQPGRRISGTEIVLEKVSSASAEPGSIAFPAGISNADAVSSLGDVVLTKSLAKGDFVKSADLGQVEGDYLMRLMRDVSSGETLDRSNVMVSLYHGAAPVGALVFKDVDEASETYLETGALKISRDIEAGEVVKIEDVSGGSGSIYVLRAAGTFAPGSMLTIEDVDIASMMSTSIPRGAISFPTKDAAEIYVSTSGGLTAAASISFGDVFVVSSIAKTGGTALPDGSLPNTLNEYLDYEKKYPERTMLIDERILVGSQPMVGDKVNLWVETASTTGPYGTIKVSKVLSEVPLLTVTNNVVLDEGTTTETHFWSSLGRSGFQAIADARKDGRVAFMLNSQISVGDFIGNGAVCKSDKCSVSRGVSDDLRAVRLAFTEDGELAAVDDIVTNDPFRILDGVDSDIERRMIARGYKTFRDVAGWEANAIRVIAFNLEISDNLAVYIRQQATNIINNAEKSRQDLGLTSSEVN
jgi:hypothetical protein